MNFFNQIYITLNDKINEDLIIWTEDGEIKSSGGSLLRHISGLANHFTTERIKQKQQVLLAVPVGPDLICALLAVMAIGAIPVLPPANIKGKEIVDLLTDRGIKAIILKKRPPLLQRLMLRIKGIKPFYTNTIKASKQINVAIADVPADQPALISHSSGSTGKAKAILRSHQVLEAQHHTLKDAFPPVAGQRDFPLFPNILLHNLTGGTVSVLPAIEEFKLQNLNPGAIVSQINRFKVQTMTGNVFYFQSLLKYMQEAGGCCECVKALGIGGSPVPESLIKDLKAFFPEAELFIIYGSSEAEPIAIRKASNNEVIRPADGYCVGTTVNSIELKFSDTGEIMVRGKHVAVEANCWLATGDFGELKHGSLYLTGRKGNENKIGGFRHYQIEHLLQHIPGVESAAAIARVNGFAIFYSGNARENEVAEALSQDLPENIILKVSALRHLPVDNRHLSKVLYDKLK